MTSGARVGVFVVFVVFAVASSNSTKTILAQAVPLFVHLFKEEALPISFAFLRGKCCPICCLTVHGGKRCPIFCLTAQGANAACLFVGLFQSEMLPKSSLDFLRGKRCPICCLICSGGSAAQGVC